MKVRYKLRFEKRERLRNIDQVIVPIVCILLAFLLCGIALQIKGHGMVKVYSRLLWGGFGTWGKTAASVLQAIPLMLCGLGVAVTLKMSVINIGGEGQFAMGAFAAAGVALFLYPYLPGRSVVVAAILLGFLAGALWGIIGILPKVYLGINETIITLLLNYIALLWIDHLCYGPWRDKANANMPYSPTFVEKARLSTFGDTGIHIGLVLAIVAAVLIYLFYKYTVRGYHMRVIGANIKSATYAGLNIKKNLLLSMIIAGGLAGVAGATYVTGVVYRLQPDIANNAGYTAIIIAFLARFNPFAVLIVSILFGALNQGSYSIQLLGLSSSVATMIEGAIFLCVLGGEIFLNNRLVLMRIQSGGPDDGPIPNAAPSELAVQEPLREKLERRG
jgi:ABC-type uncharacterized transport system permease subunit